MAAPESKAGRQGQGNLIRQDGDRKMKGLIEYPKDYDLEWKNGVIQQKRGSKKALRKDKERHAEELTGSAHNLTNPRNSSAET